MYVDEDNRLAMLFFDDVSNVVQVVMQIDTGKTLDELKQDFGSRYPRQTEFTQAEFEAALLPPELKINDVAALTRFFAEGNVSVAYKQGDVRIVVGEDAAVSGTSVSYRNNAYLPVLKARAKAVQSIRLMCEKSGC